MFGPHRNFGLQTLLLLVEVDTAHFQVEGIHPATLVRIHPHREAFPVKREPRAAELEVLLVAQGLQEVRNEKCELVEERDLELLEERGMNPRKKCLQVSSFASERKQRRLGSAACVMMDVSDTCFSMARLE